jgi:hypothetical protein
MSTLDPHKKSTKWCVAAHQYFLLVCIAQAIVNMEGDNVANQGEAEKCRDIAKVSMLTHLRLLIEMP